MSTLRSRRSLFFGLRLAVSIILVLFVVNLVRFKEFVELISSINLIFLFSGLFLIVLERFLLAYKWNVLLAAKQLQLPFLKIIKLYYISNFIGTFAPSSLGIDLFRIYGLYKHQSNATEATCSVLVDKVIALSSSMLLALGSVLLFPMVTTDETILPAILLVMLPIAGFVVVAFNGPIQAALLNSLDVIRLASIKDRLKAFLESFQGYARHRGMIGYVLLLSFVFQFLRVMVSYVVSLALNLDVSIVYFLVYMPIIIVVTMIPISVAGIGVRESAFIYFFAKAGMSVPEAVTLSMLIYVLVIISSLPGGIIYLIEGFALGQRTAPLQPVTRR